jgi:hypothetical protein
MKVLITGATGLVGNQLVKLLLQNGTQVHYLTTSKSKVKGEPNFKGFYWNPEKGEIDLMAFDQVDAIIHLAGATISKRWTDSYKQEIINSRVLSTRLLYQTLSKSANQVKHFVCASGVSVYPDSLEQVYNEDFSTIDDSFLGNVVHKWESEVDILSKLNIKIVKVRTGIVLSTKGGALAELIKPIKFGIGSSFGTGKQYQSWIHLEDLARIYQYIINEELEGIYNAVAPYPVSSNELSQTIAKKLQVPYFMPNIPKFVMKIILGEMHELLFTSQNVSAKKILNKGFQFKFANLDKALENLLK